MNVAERTYIAGRDLVGVVIKAPETQSRVQRGDVVLAASTDYRDLRKAAYQEYAVSTTFNIARIPKQVSKLSVSGLGVAFVAAALALGVCLSCDFSNIDEAFLT